MTLICLNINLSHLTFIKGLWNDLNKKIIQITKTLKNPDNSKIIDNSPWLSQISMVHYKWDNPLFIIENKVYTLKFLGHNINDKSVSTKKWENINLTKIRLDTNAIIIWDNVSNIELNKDNLIDALRMGNTLEWTNNYKQALSSAKGLINKASDWINKGKETLRHWAIWQWYDDLASAIPWWKISELEDESKSIKYRYKEIPHSTIKLVEVLDLQNNKKL